ncbi:TetR/AcrR family transcriptional regulator [Eubacterium oxidoreducens]|uniref:Transcriptional regulator, TetR family n=1 Tax=Eubacterium oxidoreducens TaxID=1732 RepID=A0A1G6AWU2_EUBOX|nr:TetR/AcrR family transcriptional regulator [Eubacterium oxidoreducens]SDB12769.1 transcriptional regulator, TetR family [Eubacterium oxidoreducens]
MNRNRDNKVKVLEATTRVFKKKGMKFTMDDIAKELSMSKKTIYTIFRDKEEILYDMVDYAFDKIKESEKQVLNDHNMDTVEKLRNLLGVLPEGYKELDFRQLIMLRTKYPVIYQKIEQRLENGWEATLRLIEQGIEEGVLRPVNLVIFKSTYEAAIEQFLERDILISNNIEYADALEEVVAIMVDGIIEKRRGIGWKKGRR